MSRSIKKATKAQNRFKAVEVSKQDPSVRSNNFGEVVLGYTEEQALAEASRCLNCPNPKCVSGCPVGVEIPAFISCINKRKYQEAISKIKEKNSLPAICGRVCPQEEQCQKQCIMGRKGESVSIGRLERFVADFEYEKGLSVKPPRIEWQKSCSGWRRSRRVNCSCGLGKVGVPCGNF